MIEVNGGREPYDPEDGASAEVHPVLCNLGATDGGAHAAASRKASRHAHGWWDVGAANVLDRREGYDFADPNDRSLARRRVTSESPPPFLVRSLRQPPTQAGSARKNCTAKLA